MSSQNQNPKQSKSQISKIPYRSETVYEGISFASKEYDRAFDTGTLRSMIFYCPNKKEIDRLRSRCIGYARSRLHILETTLLDDNHIRIRYTGRLPEPR